MIIDTPEKRHDYALNIGLKWLSDSSLEKWFPFTAQELAGLKTDLTQLKAERDALRVALVHALEDLEKLNVGHALIEDVCGIIPEIKGVLSATAQKQDKTI